MTTTPRDGREPPRVAVIGAGAMGVSLSALLGARALVTLVVRDRALREQVGRDGVRAVGLLKATSTVDVVPSISALTDAGPIDAVFVATKTTAIEPVATELSPVLRRLAPGGRPPLIVSIQNGIEPGRTLHRLLGGAPVLRMVMNYGAMLDAPGVARVTLNSPPHAIGGPDATLLPESQWLADLFVSCSLECQAVADIEPRVWTKGIINAAMNPVAALTDSTVGEVLDSPARLIVERLMHEGIAAAGADGIDLGAEASERMWRTLEAARPHTPSMVEDIRRGRPTEIGQLNRQVIEHARRTGVPVPSHELIAALIDAFDWRVFHRESQQDAGAQRRGLLPRHDGPRPPLR